LKSSIFFSNRITYKRCRFNKRIFTIFRWNRFNTYKFRKRYSIDSSKDLIKLFQHFEKFPLLTQKAADSILFKQVVDLINNKGLPHLTLEGINKIVNIKASMNLGLSDMLKSEFQNNNSVKRPVINTDNIDIPNN
jgi:hypothetical protein